MVTSKLVTLLQNKIVYSEILIGKSPDRKETKTNMYKAMTVITEKMMIRGSDLAGFFTSSVTRVIESNPSYAHNPSNIARLTEGRMLI